MSGMGRREFVALLGGAAAAWPLAAWAQQSPIRPLIGVLSPLSAAAGVQNTQAFRSALRELGYIEGRNATVELRYANGEADRMEALARELVALKPDVLVAGSAPGLVAARNATRTIPIVTIVPEDPVASGIASSIAKPSGNITGTWSLGDYTLSANGWIFSSLRPPALGASPLSLIPTWNRVYELNYDKVDSVPRCRSKCDNNDRVRPRC
jgi:ABC transporter substrate binding protein